MVIDWAYVVCKAFSLLILKLYMCRYALMVVKVGLVNLLRNHKVTKQQFFLLIYNSNKDLLLLNFINLLSINISFSYKSTNL